MKPIIDELEKKDKECQKAKSAANKALTIFAMVMIMSGIAYAMNPSQQGLIMLIGTFLIGNLIMEKFSNGYTRAVAAFGGGVDIAMILNAMIDDHKTNAQEGHVCHK